MSLIPVTPAPRKPLPKFSLSKGKFACSGLPTDDTETTWNSDVLVSGSSPDNLLAGGVITGKACRPPGVERQSFRPPSRNPVFSAPEGRHSIAAGCKPPEKDNQDPQSPGGATQKTGFRVKSPQKRSFRGPRQPGMT